VERHETCRNISMVCGILCFTFETSAFSLSQYYPRESAAWTIIDLPILTSTYRMAVLLDFTSKRQCYDSLSISVIKSVNMASSFYNLSFLELDVSFVHTDVPQIYFYPSVY
jgi:hypothetical protein